MPSIEEILNPTSQPKTPPEIRDFVSAILTASDLPQGEKGAFEVGYIVGLSYALIVDKQDAVTELTLRMLATNATS